MYLHLCLGAFTTMSRARRHRPPSLLHHVPRRIPRARRPQAAACDGVGVSGWQTVAMRGGAYQVLDGDGRQHVAQNRAQIIRQELGIIES